MERCYLQSAKTRTANTINFHLVKRFKIVANKNIRKMSNIVENLIKRYVESRV